MVVDEDINVGLVEDIFLCPIDANSANSALPNHRAELVGYPGDEQGCLYKSNDGIIKGVELGPAAPMPIIRGSAVPPPNFDGPNRSFRITFDHSQIQCF